MTIEFYDLQLDPIAEPYTIPFIERRDPERYLFVWPTYRQLLGLQYHCSARRYHRV